MNFRARLAVEPCPLVAASEIFGWNFKPVAQTQRVAKQKTARKVSLERAGLPKRKFAKSVRRLSQPIKNPKNYKANKSLKSLNGIASSSFWLAQIFFICSHFLGLSFRAILRSNFSISSGIPSLLLRR